MVRIEKKIWPKYFQAIIDGKKTYELRLADFDCDFSVLENYLKSVLLL
jgi:hypothetical protein